MPTIYKFTSKTQSSIIIRKLQQHCKLIDYAEVRIAGGIGEEPYPAVVGFREEHGRHLPVVNIPIGKTTYWSENLILIEELSFSEYLLFKEFCGKSKYPNWSLVSTSLIDSLKESFKTKEGRNLLLTITAVTIIVLALTLLAVFTAYTKLNH